MYKSCVLGPDHDPRGKSQPRYIENEMFTGLIQNVGTLINVISRGNEALVQIRTNIDQFILGESIAVMGACLSVTQFGPGQFSAFASKETLEKTGIGELRPGTRVNLERALRVGDPLGGHIVTGHFDARVRLLSRTPIGEAERLTIALPPAPIHKQIAPKGSVALDGISLTVNDVHVDRFDVMVIPLTQEHTTLRERQPGDLLNIETDVLAKYVARQFQSNENGGGGIDVDLLTRAGFMR